MNMSEAEARAAAIADGIPEEAIKPAILAFYGYVSSTPTAGLEVGPVVLPDEVKADLLALQEEAKKNALPAQIATQLKSVLGFVMSIAGKGALCIALVLVLNGCGVSTQAVHSVDQAAISVKALNDQHLSFEEKFIQDYKSKEVARIQELYTAAVSSATMPIQVQVKKTVKVPVKAADGSDAYKDEIQTVTETQMVLDARVSEALQTQRVRLLQAMEQNMILLRSQQVQICANAANAAAYLEGLKAYFEQRQVTYESLMSAETSLFSFLETFIKKEK
jgi:hypothetical protein